VSSQRLLGLGPIRRIGNPPRSIQPRQLLDGVLQRVHFQVRVAAMDLRRFVARQLHSQLRGNPGIGKRAGEGVSQCISEFWFLHAVSLSSQILSSEQWRISSWSRLAIC
jgi:hypothetical protein